MPRFSVNDREMFEEMIVALENCTNATNRLFQDEIAPDDSPPFLDPELDRDMENYLWFPEYKS